MAELFDSLPVGPVLRTFVQHLIAFCNRPETASQGISSRCMGPRVLGKCVQFLDHRFNRSGEILPNPSDAAFSVVCRTSINADRK